MNYFKNKKNALVLALLVAGLISGPTSYSSGLWATPMTMLSPVSSGWTPDLNTMAGVIISEAGSFHSSDEQSSPTAGEGEVAGDADDKSLAFRQIALTLKCRKRNNRNRGTAPPASVPNTPTGDQAGKAAEDVDDAWEDATEEEKDEMCRLSQFFIIECWNYVEGPSGRLVKKYTGKATDKWATDILEAGTYRTIPAGNGAFPDTGAPGPTRWCRMYIPTVPVH